MTSIPCCIIDDHCDLIPFLHALWRTKKLNYSNLFFFHIDSHPDLVPPIPSSSADNICCNDLQNISILYDLLNTPGSISEFIIPLYINQHITNMIWLHPSSSQQFLNQKYQFYVGDIDNNRGIGVTLQESYYYDEGLVYDINDLTNIKPINFISCIDKEFIPYTCSTSIPSLSTLGEKKLTTWILDICLDYFTVCNPFRVDLEQMLVKELSTNKEQIAINYFTSPSDILNIIQQTILHLSFRRNHVDTCLYASRSNLESRRNEKVLFEILIKDLLSLPIIPSDTPLKSQFLEFFYCSCHEHLPQPVTSSQTHARTFLDMISALPHSIRLEILRLGSSFIPLNFSF